MKYSLAQPGRIFILRLENGEIVHEEIERFAREQSIKAAALIIVGGADDKSTFVVGPAQGDARPVNPMKHVLEGVHEVAGVGTLFPDEQGNPSLHMHMACGRNGKTVTGCIRTGVKVWEVMEVILFEISDCKGKRVFDPTTGFNLLNP
ncbi:MAG: DNA-binding protein [Thermodesulfobacteriota bacterium]|jgi:predicted DNA-binding protein with PD1-like motif|nr:MAG: DNA-binding protein [Thermodesulfobacteriota bacterium]